MSLKILILCAALVVIPLSAMAAPINSQEDFNAAAQACAEGVLQKAISDQVASPVKESLKILDFAPIMTSDQAALNRIYNGEVAGLTKYEVVVYRVHLSSFDAQNAMQEYTGSVSMIVAATPASGNYENAPVVVGAPECMLTRVGFDIKNAATQQSLLENN